MMNFEGFGSGRSLLHDSATNICLE